MSEIIHEKRKWPPFLGTLTIAFFLISLLLYLDNRLSIKTMTVAENGAIPEKPYDRTEPIIESKDTAPGSVPSPDLEPPIEKDILVITKKLSDLEYSAWIPVWDFADGINNINTLSYSLGSVSPVWFGVNDDGSLIDRRTSSSGLISSLSNEIRVIPTISLFDADIMRSILTNDDNYQRHIDEILHVVDQSDYDGIDIDYEMIYLENKSAYLGFLKKMSEEMDKRGKIFSVTVLSQWGASSYQSFPETRNVQEYKEISKYADEIRIMCYDFTSPGSNIPGPVGPIDWIDSVLSYATSHIGSEKLVLGVHLYGYRWDQNGVVNATTYDQIEEFSTSDDYNYLFNRSYDEGVAEYSIGDRSYKHFFQTPEGVLARAQLALKHNIKGVAFWRLGRESTILESLFKEVNSNEDL